MLEQVQGVPRILICLCLSGLLRMTFVMGGISRGGSQESGKHMGYLTRAAHLGDLQRPPNLGAGGTVFHRHSPPWPRPGRQMESASGSNVPLAAHQEGKTECMHVWQAKKTLFCTVLTSLLLTLDVWVSHTKQFNPRCTVTGCPTV